MTFPFTDEDVANGYCPGAPDNDGHCQHWLEGYKCCRCGDGPMDPQEAVDNGMYDTLEEATADLNTLQPGQLDPPGEGFGAALGKVGKLKLSEAKSLS